jgi:hypothetical protein
MPSKNESEPLVSRVQSSFQQLSTAASTLNSASDRLSELVAELDSSLKTLNVGLVCWVDINRPWTSADGLRTYSQKVGYAKISGKWGVAVRTVDRHEYDDYPDTEEWAFSEAPRQLRLEAVEFIPQLLEKLAKEAEKHTREVTEKTDQVQQLVTAVKGSVRR